MPGYQELTVPLQTTALPWSIQNEIFLLRDQLPTSESQGVLMSTIRAILLGNLALWVDYIQ